jgi:glycosyltransferase involved in cell wall biosynthesis
MKIAIDCRMIDHSGIGSFTQGVLKNLPTGHRYVLLGDTERLKPYEGKDRELISCKIKPYSGEEMFWLPRVKFDAVFCPSISLFAFFLPRKRFITVHDVLFLDHPEFCSSLLDWAAKKAYLWFSCFFSRAIFSVSKYSAARIREKVKTKKPIHVVPNGLVDQETFVNRLRPVKEKKSIVFVGNLKKNKNLVVLLDALKLSIAQGQNFVLTVIGASSGLRTSDKAIVKRFGFEDFGDRIKFPGWLSREEMLACISRAKYLVQPSLYEGFSITPLEALACGTQPLISDIPAHREIYSQAPVKFFDPRNPRDLLRLMTEAPDEIPIGFAERFVEENGLSYGIAAERIVHAISESQ